MIEGLRKEGLAPAPVLADAGYGNASDFRDGVTRLGMTYMVGIQSTSIVWAPGARPLPPKPKPKRGPRSHRLQVDPDHPPKRVKEIALSRRPELWKEITWWEEGSRGPMTSRFTVLRIRSAHRAERQTRVPALGWLLIEWPEGEPEPTHYWLSTLPASTPVAELNRMAKLRWRIERGYQVLKDQLGMDHFEGRTWRGCPPPLQPGHCGLRIPGRRGSSAFPPYGPGNPPTSPICLFQKSSLDSPSPLAWSATSRTPWKPFRSSSPRPSSPG